MGMANHSARTAATLRELEARVRVALARNPLCRRLKFDVLPTLLNGYGANWTVKFHAHGGLCPDEAYAIVRDIQDAYQLSTVEPERAPHAPPRWLRPSAGRQPAALRAMHGHN